MTREQVVVVGAGMVGHRFVDELVRRDRAGRFDVQLVGAEDYAPYNRILLSDVLAGRCDLAALALPEPDERVAFERGTRAVGVDRDAGTVELSHGGRRPVRPPGARHRRPGVRAAADAGWPTGCPAHAHVLRTIDDCRDLAARALNARHAVVLGGGPLGLEAACGLVRRGVAGHAGARRGRTSRRPSSTPPRRASSRRRSSDLGIDVRTGASPRRGGRRGTARCTRCASTTARRFPPTCSSSRLRRPPAHRAGAQPRDCTVGSGIVVGADLRSPDDPRVSAIGDCAEPPEGGTGLVGTRLGAGDPAGRRC